MPGVNPPNQDQFFVRLADMERRLRAMETQQQIAFTNALGQVLITMGLVPGSNPAEYGFQLLNPATGAQIAFLGEDGSGNAVFNVTGTETVTGTLNVTGNMVVGGTLSLPNGIINNAALANPISFGQCDYAVNSTSLSATMSTIASTTIPVPSGFSQAALMVSIEVGATATSASGIQARAVAGSATGDTIAGSIVAGASLSVSASLATTLTGLGSSITVAAQGNYYGSAPNSGSADAHVAALAIFAR